MPITRRGLGLAAAATGLAVPALAQSEPIRIGWLAALTGPSSAPAVGFNRGVMYAAEAINGAGGVKGRKVEIITRDTQGDPTKAVNATQEMISQLRVHAIWGPTNSGESLAVTAIMARAKMPNIHPCVVDSLIDPAKYPNAFRIAPSNTQWDDAVRGYTLNIAKVKKVAVIGDTTGYGVSAANASATAFQKDGAEVVYKANIDATQPDMTPDMLRARNAGAQAIIIWSVSTGMIARLLNTRANMGWDVPFIGHPALASGEIGALIDKPANWEKVYAIGYKSCSYDASGKLPPRNEELLQRLQGKVNLHDTLLWWVACGIDAVDLVAKAVEATGSVTKEAITGHWNGLKDYPGYFGEYSFTATDHNGYPVKDVVMSAASSGKNGTFALAPGYG
ncbi:ABC transporter substrate-binding protein [Belnapia rosea]|uniref:Amino acid/amide ABC transporter substrate-binding protein, HAAT family n=1 Tax=Belnapia rosea TaxID=938405 RepID=A0A1G6KRZ7_9PROT|nr:ABC transporter substrate-binding protein [Belnapia rosea]SDB23000.1 branched-chain amino acid transport system substrate-binding protein [Belnapia rosea]SDC33840.1 amino acid/amide ABC transporter substrate-binding protein, HAAT family [Belnapia rosea]